VTTEELIEILKEYPGYKMKTWSQTDTLEPFEKYDIHVDDDDRELTI